MSPKRTALLACLAATALAGIAETPAATTSHSPGANLAPSRHGGASISHRGSARPSHSGGHRPATSGRWHRGQGGHWRHSDWAWGLGLAIGLPWALGWYEPHWGPAYYPPYAYGPVYRSYSQACEEDEDCWRERLSRSEPAPPTTEVAPAAPGEEGGGPTQRPLHLNYCDAARAWFPHVRTCASGWRLVLPDYGRER